MVDKKGLPGGIDDAPKMQKGKYGDAARRLPNRPFKMPGGYSKGNAARLAAGNKPQVVAKVSGIKTTAHVRNNGKYLCRDGELVAEDNHGFKLEGLSAVQDRLQEWEKGFAPPRGRNTPCDAVSIIISFPGGTRAESATAIARDMLKERYADNHDYFFATHTDTRNPHIHVMLRARGANGKQLQRKKADIDQLRQDIARHAGRYGVELAATRAYERGRVSDNPPRAIDMLQRRGETPKAKAAFDAGALERIRSGQIQLSDYERYLIAGNREVRGDLLKQGIAAMALAGRKQGEEKTEFFQLGYQLFRRAAEIPVPMTKMRRMMVAAGLANPLPARPEELDRQKKQVDYFQRKATEAWKSMEPSIKERHTPDMAVIEKARITLQERERNAKSTGR